MISWAVLDHNRPQVEYMVALLRVHLCLSSLVLTFVKLTPN